MSALGHKADNLRAGAMSAFPPKADIRRLQSEMSAKCQKRTSRAHPNDDPKRSAMFDRASTTSKNMTFIDAIDDNFTPCHMSSKFGDCAVETKTKMS